MKQKIRTYSVIYKVRARRLAVKIAAAAGTEWRALDRRTALAISTGIVILVATGAIAATSFSSPPPARASAAAATSSFEPAGFKSQYSYLIRPKVADSVPAAAPVTTVMVRPGDNLSKIARNLWGNAKFWPAIFCDNHLASTVIFPGHRLKTPVSRTLTCRSAQQAQDPPVQLTASVSSGPAAPDPAPVAVSGSGHYGDPGPADAAVGALWESAGGPASQESTAECIAWNESGDQIVVLSKSDDEGLWQINASNAPTSEMQNPFANAAEAVKLWDADGWSPWTTAGDCGV